MQYFRGDETEQKYVDSTNYLFDALDLSINDFSDKAYFSDPLGEVIHDNQFAPLTNAIRKDVFVNAFKEIFEAFEFAGTFESYLLVFRKIFGELSEVEFTIPNPGHLQIAIEAEEASSFVALYREINGGSDYSTGALVTDLDEVILFRSVLGIDSQDELDKVLRFLAPNGIFVEISVDFPEPE